MEPARSPRRPWRRSLAFSCAAALILTAARARTPIAEGTREPPVSTRRATDSSRVSFTRDVAPILQKNCQLCHSPGGIGPMPLLTCEHARRHAPLIKQVVQAREMPPYQYDTHIGITSGFEGTFTGNGGFEARWVIGYGNVAARYQSVFLYTGNTAMEGTTGVMDPMHGTLVWRGETVDPLTGARHERRIVTTFVSPDEIEEVGYARRGGPEVKTYEMTYRRER